MGFHLSIRWRLLIRRRRRIVSKLGPGFRIEIHHAPFPVPFHLVEILLIRKRLHIFRNEHGGYALFCEQIAHDALTFLRERGFFGGVFLPLASSTICWRASIILMILEDSASGVAMISWLLALAWMISHNRCRYSSLYLVGSRLPSCCR